MYVWGVIFYAEIHIKNKCFIKKVSLVKNYGKFFTFNTPISNVIVFTKQLQVTSKDMTFITEAPLEG